MFLEDELMSLERNSQEHLKSLTPYQRRKLGEQCDPGEYDVMMEAIIGEASKYSPSRLFNIIARLC